MTVRVLHLIKGLGPGGAEQLVVERRARSISVGRGPLQAEVRAQHSHLGLDDRFLIPGCLQDATRIMSAFDIRTLSSLKEGLPIALMGAMALGPLVVATSATRFDSAVAAQRLGQLCELIEPPL